VRGAAILLRLNPAASARQAALTSPRCSAGTSTSTRITGSSRTGRAFFAASWNAIVPAILNAIFDESTV
jgi:hypothetical protein